MTAKITLNLQTHRKVECWESQKDKLKFTELYLQLKNKCFNTYKLQKQNRIVGVWLFFSMNATFDAQTFKTLTCQA